MRICEQKVKCEKCGKLISKINFSKHQKGTRCGKIEYERYIDKDLLKCNICEKIFKNTQSLGCHFWKAHTEAGQKLKPMMNRAAWNKGLTKETNESLQKASNTFQANLKSGKFVPSFTGRILTDDHKKKISDSRKLYLNEHPDQVPYLLNHSSKESYPEKYFKCVFESENIPLKYHLQFSIYQLDFYNLDKKIDVEIDGEQHFISLKNIERDQKRTEYLESLGWKVVRIRWSEYQKKTSEEKHEVIQQIRTILE
jgi:very-short-patch-repair endonuclease/uncharacterized C2H2 Zn-finger protein